MKIQSYLKKANMKEIIICLSLIVIGYMTAQLFMRKYNRFSVGGQCPSDIKCTEGNVCEKSASNICNKRYYTNASNVSYMCGYGNLGGGVHNCHGISIPANASCSKCNGSSPPAGKPPTPAGKPPATPTPGPPTPGPSYNCSESMCVSVSGTSGTYSSESECLNSDCEKTTSTPGQCILGDYLSFSNDGCKYKGKTYLDYTTAPSGACDCRSKYSPTKITFTLIIIGIILFFVIFPAILVLSRKIK